MAEFLHTMVRITDPEKSRAFYEALGFRFERDMDIVRNGELEATNYFYGIGDHGSVLELTFNHDGRTTTSAPATATSPSASTTSSSRSRAEGAGHRGRARALPRARRRLADLLRPGSGRLPHRADRPQWPQAEADRSLVVTRALGRLTAPATSTSAA